MPGLIPIGIDLGTTNSAVCAWWHEKIDCVANKDGDRITPSYVYYGVDGSVLVGKTARGKSITDPENVFYDSKRLLDETMDSPKIQAFFKDWSFKVGFKEEDYINQKVHYITSNNHFVAPEQVSSVILKSLLEDVCRRFELTPERIGAVIAVPAHFNMSQKRATLEAAKIAGINVLQLVSEPVAAALCYHHDNHQAINDGDKAFVFDFGGGTFDVSILKKSGNTFKVIALGGDNKLGGRDFDLILAEEGRKKLLQQLKKHESFDFLSAKNRYKLFDVARDCKEGFSTDPESWLHLSDLHPKADDVKCQRESFDAQTIHLVDKVRKCCREALQEARLEPAEVDHVILVGGSSKLPLVQDLMREIFGNRVMLKKTVTAQESIAKGAAVFCVKLINASTKPFFDKLAVQDVLPLSIGVEVPGSLFKPILFRSTPIPATKSLMLTTTSDFQGSAAIPIYEGLSENVEQNTYLGELLVQKIPPKPKDEVTVEVSLSLDGNGILRAEATILGTGVVVGCEIEYQMKY